MFASREQGLDTPVQEQGKNFSTGERQLIAFARAMYRDAPILILDEATASIDSDTESRLSRALAELLRGRTALVIAHRLSTVRAADRILVLQRGRLVEQGSHDQLIAHGGLYARLHELQFSRTDHASAGALPLAQAAPRRISYGSRFHREDGRTGGPRGFCCSSRAAPHGNCAVSARPLTTRNPKFSPRGPPVLPSSL